VPYKLTLFSMMAPLKLPPRWLLWSLLLIQKGPAHSLVR